MNRIFATSQAVCRRIARTVRIAASAGLVAAAIAMVAIPSPIANAAVVSFDKVDTQTHNAIEFGTVTACANKVFTPVKNAEDNMQISGMSLVNDNLELFNQVGNQHLGGEIHDIEITGLNGCNYFVTAVRTSNSALKLISWYSGNQGFERLGDTGNNGAVVTEIALASLSYPGHNPDPNAGIVVAATRDVNGHYVLRTYGVVGGSFELKDSAMGEAATEIDVVTIPSQSPMFNRGRAIIAYRNAQGQLRLATYLVDNGGQLSMSMDSGNQAGSVEKLSMAAYDSQRVVTAVKTSEGNLKLIPWRINQDGSIDRLHGQNDPTFNDPNAGYIDEIDVVGYNFNYAFYKHVVTAVRTSDGKLKLIAWGIDGGDIVRLGSSGDQAGAASQIRVAWSNNSQRVITSMRDSQGNLRVIAWRVY